MAWLIWSSRIVTSQCCSTPPYQLAIPTFTPQQTVAVGNANALAMADVNGDGKPDLIVTTTSGAGVGVLLNTTAPGQPRQVSPRSRSLALPKGRAPSRLLISMATASPIWSLRAATLAALP